MRSDFGTVIEDRAHPGFFIAIWPEGKRRRWKRGFTSRKNARLWNAKRRVELEGLRAQHVEKRVTFAALGAEYVRVLLSRKSADETMRRVRRDWKMIEADFGEVPVDAVDRALVQKWVETLSVDREYAPGSVKAYVSTLKAAFEIAVERGAARANPCRKLDLPRVIRKPTVYTTQEKMRLLLAHLPRHEDTREWGEVSYATGLRVSHVLAMEWPNLADDFSWALVTDTKNHTTYRVDVGEIGREALRRMHKRRGARPARGPFLVFPNLTRNKVGYRLRRAARDMNLPGFSSHQFRKNLAAHADESGAGLRAIQRQLGHRSRATTLGYLEYTSEGQSAVGMVDEARHRATLRRKGASDAGTA